MLFFRQSFIVWVICLSVIFLGLFIQAHLFLHQDVSWLMHAAERMLAGGTYSKNFFDPDPPMILYVYSVPIGISHLFNASYWVSLQLFGAFLTLLVLMLCYRMSRVIFSENETSSAHLFLIAISLICMILPIAAFGQRDHLFVILIIPYLCAVALREDNKSIAPWFAFSVGVLAGVGFLIKPFFLLTFFLVELFVLIRAGKLRALFRVETITVSIIAVVYLLSIPIFFPDYLKVIVPHCYQFFFAGNFLQGRGNFFLLDVFTLVGIMIVLYLKNDAKESLISVLLIAMLSSIAIYFIQGGMFLYYHIYPVLAFVLLLAMILYGQLQQKLAIIDNKLFYYGFSGLLACVIFALSSIRMGEQLNYYLKEKQAGSRHKIIQFMQSKPAYKTCYFITAYHMAFPMADYAYLKADSRYYNFASLSILLRKKRETQNPAIQKSLGQESQHFFNEINAELVQLHPDLIFIDKDAPDGFNELREHLLTDPHLMTFWQQYRQLSDVTFYHVYERSVLS